MCEYKCLFKKDKQLFYTNGLHLKVFYFYCSIIDLSYKRKSIFLPK